MAIKIGSLLIRLAVEHGILQEGLARSERDVAKTTKAIQQRGRDIADFGQKMSLAVTAPVLAIGTAVVKMTGDFEASMNKVSISTNGTAAELSAMSDMALKIGKDSVFGATEAADAMDMLAKNGLLAKDILNGAAEAAVNLAAAAGSDLAPAADAITDVMQQFKISAAGLPNVVNQITGAVNASKLDFEDFANAIGQAGGVASSSGVEFVDFNAVLAGTSSLFASGSDAGTSFKTFLIALGGTSSTAAAEIENLGLKFFDAQGNLRSMSEVAQELRSKLAGLTEEQRTSSLSKIFGNDGMRTAVGLMNLGAAGLDNIKTKIAQTNAADQAAQRMKGFYGQLDNLNGALETLAIRVGQSGILESVTGIVTGLAAFIDHLSETAPWVLQLGAGMATLAATFGPVIYVIGKFVSAGAGSIAMLGGWPVVITNLGTAISVLLGPLGLVVGAVGAVVAAWYYWDEIKAIAADVGSAVSGWWSDNVAPALASAAEGLVQSASDWANFGVAVIGEIAQLVQGARDWLVDRMRAVFDGLVGGLRGVQDFVSGVFSNAWRAVTELAVNAVRAIANGIETLFPGLIQMGRDIIAGIIAGIKAAPGAVRDALLGVVQSGYESVKDFLGIRSPSRLFMEVGANIALGLANGVTGSAGAVDAALDGMASQTEVQTVRIAQTVEQMTSTVMGHLRGLTDGIKKGDFFGILGSLIGIGTTLGGAGVFGAGVQSALQSTPGLSGSGGVLGAIPGNANGTAYHPGGLMKVGERGPEILQVPRGGRVVPNHELREAGGAGPAVVNNYYTLPSDEFWGRVDGRAAAVAQPVAQATVGRAFGRMQDARERSLVG